MFTFTLTSDTHVGRIDPGSARVFENALRDMASFENRLDLFVSLGDCTEFGMASEWNTYFDLLGRMDPADDCIVLQGNHDVRARRFGPVLRRFCALYNGLTGESIDRYWYFKDVGPCRFIALGTEKTMVEKAYFSPEQLAWLDERLAEAAAPKKPVFVLCHEPLRNTHGLPTVWDTPFKNTGYVGEQNDALQAILRKYDNLFYLTGHLHNGFGRLTYQELDGIRSVNVPATGNKVNKNGDCPDVGCGMVVEVTEDAVAFRARNFDKGEWLPLFDKTYPLV